MVLTTGSPSPSQGKRLRDEQKWHLINYIRTLAPTGKGQPEKKN